ncbi:FMN-binding protein [Candidatus Solirubrobacter pratensis]|uniref:FMN-binding protein n=1 Tax=Candidatus Solirubrobacter pratensis TaxID=1298857 RepID=UPI0004245A7A|nr:FMN-binding protein [Candidatus Solirubrobacter pratensis]
MRRAIAALVVTAAAVIWLARYETHPPAPPKRPAAKAPGDVVAGPIFTTPFSAIQVGVVMRHGRLADVRTLILTGAGAHTQALNARAEPILRRRALAAGSARFDVVSGATYTSESYKDSLQAAIDKARAAQ